MELLWFVLKFVLAILVFLGGIGTIGIIVYVYLNRGPRNIEYQTGQSKRRIFPASTSTSASTPASLSAPASTPVRRGSLCGSLSPIDGDGDGAVGIEDGCGHSADRRARDEYDAETRRAQRARRVERLTRPVDVDDLLDPTRGTTKGTTYNEPFG